MSPLPPSSITGLVLAGGRGARMGGVDKGLVPWHGEPLALHALRRLRPQVQALAVNANRHLDIYGGWDVPVWPDADGAFAGPLAGLLAGLDHCHTDWLATVPCDSPLFPHDLVARLAAAAAGTGSLLVLAATPGDGRPAVEPVFLLAHRSLRADLHAALAEGERRMRRWAARHRPALVVFEDAGAFANANTQEDLAALPRPAA